MSPIPVVQLDDATDGPARTTRTLLASLVVRTRTLALLSGSQTVGSLVGGVAALGREQAPTGKARASGRPSRGRGRASTRRCSGRR